MVRALVHVLRLLAFLLIIITFIPYGILYHTARAFTQTTPPPAPPSKEEPVVIDPNLRIELVYKGLEYPTSMAFLGRNDILVLESYNLPGSSRDFI
jgi:glucose/arabinose dehydrogenase